MRTSTCKSCKGEIIWGVTEAGKNMPVDAATVTEGTRYATVQNGETTYLQRVTAEGVPGHLSHFATCPNANQHRRR